MTPRAPDVLLDGVDLRDPDGEWVEVIIVGKRRDAGIEGGIKLAIREVGGGLVDDCPNLRVELLLAGQRDREC